MTEHFFLTDMGPDGVALLYSNDTMYINVTCDLATRSYRPDTDDWRITAILDSRNIAEFSVKYLTTEACECTTLVDLDDIFLDKEGNARFECPFCGRIVETDWKHLLIRMWTEEHSLGPIDFSEVACTCCRTTILTLNRVGDHIVSFRLFSPTADEDDDQGAVQ